MPVKLKMTPRALAARARYRRKVGSKLSTTASAALTRKVKNIQLNQCETKRKGWYFGALEEGTGGVIQLGHNITKYYPTFYATDQDINNPSGAMSAANPLPFAAGPRIGNEIIPKAISIKLQLDNAVGSAIHYKMIVFEYDSTLDEDDVKDSLLWQGKNGDGVNNVLRTLDSIATNRVKVIKQFIITQNEQTNSTVRNYYIKLPQRKMRYTKNDGKTPDKRDCAIALVAVGRMTEGVGNHIANASFAAKFTYKDP